MNETLVTVFGNAATEVRFRETPSGIPSASFRLASTVRRWDRERSCWADAYTSFYTVRAWRGLAENVTGSVGKGDPLIVQGRVRVHEWEKEGKRYSSVEIEAGAVGHDLSRGTSAFRRVGRSRPEQDDQRPPGDVPVEGAGASVPAEAVAAN